MRWEVGIIEGHELVSPTNGDRTLDEGRFETWIYSVGNGAQNIKCRGQASVISIQLQSIKFSILIIQQKKMQGANSWIVSANLEMLNKGADSWIISANLKL